MKRSAINIVVVVAATIVLGVYDCYGQCGQGLRADIPFDFVAAGREVEAGNYKIEYVDCTTANPIMVLRKANGRFIAVISRHVVEMSGKSSDPTLVFSDQGGRRVLAEVRDLKRGHSFRIPPQRKKEVDIARRSSPVRTVLPAKSQ